MEKASRPSAQRMSHSEHREGSVPRDEVQLCGGMPIIDGADQRINVANDDYAVGLISVLLYERQIWR
jgi:hypothetical protein